LFAGKTFVTRLGKKGQRISICFGPEVSSAEYLQRVAGAKQIRISAAIFDELKDDDTKREFKEDGDCYVATGLTFPKLDEKKEEKAAREGTLGARVEKGSVVVTTAAPAFLVAIVIPPFFF
jgi:hypothetical protein